jgi:hypothetical protein
MATTFGTDPMSSYYQQVQADLASKNPQTSLIGAEAAASAPSMAQLETQFAGQEAQLAAAPSEEAQQADYATLMAGFQLGGQGINAEQTQLQQQNASTQYGIQQQGFQQQAQENQLNFTNQLQSLIGGKAATGALNTGGSQQAQSTLGQQAQWAGQSLAQQEASAASNYATAQQNYGLIGEANGLSQQEVYARLGYGLDQLGVENDPSELVAQAGGVLSGESQGVGSILSQAGLLGGLNASAAFGGLG